MLVGGPWGTEDCRGPPWAPGGRSARPSVIPNPSAENTEDCRELQVEGVASDKTLVMLEAAQGQNDQGQQQQPWGGDLSIVGVMECWGGAGAGGSGCWGAVHLRGHLSSCSSSSGWGVMVAPAVPTAGGWGMGGGGWWLHWPLSPGWWPHRCGSPVGK